MRETLLHIPHEGWLGLPMFGMGWLLILWSVASIGWLIYLIKSQGWNSDTQSYLPIMIVVALVILFVLPWLEKKDSVTEAILGIPIRGYGTFVAIGCVVGVSMATYRAHKLGIDPDLIYSLAFCMFVGAMVGARTFFVIQYWSQFQKDTLLETAKQILSFTEGGLVVYGALLGGVPVAIWFLRRHNLPLLRMGDLIVPSLLAGLAIGRIGCLMNGCCYGGVVDASSWNVKFPPGSPPYMRQLSNGELLGVEFRGSEDQDGKREVGNVRSGSLADKQGVKEGHKIKLQSERAEVIKSFHGRAENDNMVLRMELDDGQAVGWRLSQLPAESHPVLPTQILSSINAALLSAFLWFAFPFRRQDGQIVIVFLMTYPVTRFLLEVIRTDEHGALGTGLTISQLVSLGLIAFAVVFWTRLRSRT